METPSKNTRRKFIGTLALGATAGVAAMGATLKNTNLPSFKITDEAEAWFKKIKGSHRVVFDAAEPNNAFSIIWTWGFYATNNQTGSPDSDITAVCVLRHNAIPFALEDGLWSKYKLGEVFNVTDNRTQKPATRNPYYNASDGDFPLNGVDGIKRLQERGAMFCACNLALAVYSGMVAKKMGLDPEVVRKEWVSGVLPGVQVVPAGIWALERAQGKDCAYIFAG
jgi:intracellular sulfur oxidation DsrE/DsrF family protein